MAATPDELLAATRAAATAFARAQFARDESEAGDRLMLAFRALDEHMNTGGAPPVAWRMHTHTSLCTGDCEALPAGLTYDQDAPVSPAVVGRPFPGRPGYVTGECGHAVAGSEWQAGFRRCEHCPGLEDIEADEQTCRCGGQITRFDGWLHIPNPELDGDYDHDAEPAPEAVRTGE
jgi:hypothetical protein